MPRDWTRMTAADFDREAAHRAGGTRPVPAEPDSLGTPPLFGVTREGEAEQRVADGG